MFLRPLNQLEATPIPGTQAGARNPFISPDGRWVGFWAGGQLRKVAVSGGAAVTLCDVENPRGASWGSDDMILFGQGAGGVWRVRGTGGTPEVVIEVGEEERAHGPQMLPGGEWVLFTLAAGPALWNEAQIVIQALLTGERRVVIERGRDARYPDCAGGREGVPRAGVGATLPPRLVWVPPEEVGRGGGRGCAQALLALLLKDISVLVVVVESEKAVLAVTAAAGRVGRPVLVIGVGGCWGWRGRIGKTTSANGARVDEKGPVPDFARVEWRERDVVIAYDADAVSNQQVQSARGALAAELTGRGGKVRIAELPTEDGVNGPDDFLGKHGDQALFGLVDAAKPAAKGWRRPPQSRQGREVVFEEPEPWPEPVDGPKLVEGIVTVFEKYIALPKGASTALALWVLHAFAFEAWFTAPFLCLTSPTKRCGKTLALITLGALVPRRLFAGRSVEAAANRRWGACVTALGAIG